MAKVQGISSRLTNADKIRITLRVRGDQKDILNAIQQVNQSLPLMEIKSVSLRSFPNVSAMLNIDIYFSPVTVGKMAAKAGVLPTAKEKKTYEKIANFKQLGEGVIVGESKFTPGDANRDPFIYGGR